MAVRQAGHRRRGGPTREADDHLGVLPLHPAPPNPFSQRNGRARYRRLYGARRSWLTTGRTPVPSRRDVPLEVLVAGAEDDD